MPMVPLLVHRIHHKTDQLEIEINAKIDGIFYFLLRHIYVYVLYVSDL